MKTTVLNLDPFDDATSTRDKIARCGTGRILLVLPTAYKILDRRVDLVLLSRFSQEQGAQLAIVSDDREVQAHARETGIPYFESVSLAQKLPWRRTRFQRRFFERDSHKPILAELQALAHQNNRGLLILKNRRLQIALFIIALVAIAAMVFFFLPSATIILPVIKSDQSLDIQVSASPNITSINPSGSIPAATGTTVIELSDQAPSSGTVVIPDKAAVGRAKFTNLNPMSVTVPKGTVLIAYGPPLERFVVTDGATVPAGSGKTAFVLIQAVKAGSEGNVDAGEIRAIEGSLGLQLTVTNLEATDGGKDRTVPAPTQADYVALRASLLKKLSQAAVQKLQSGLLQDEIFIPPSLKLDLVLNERRDAPVGGPADNAKLTMRAEFSAWHVRKNDLRLLAQIVLDAVLESGSTGLADTLQMENLGDPQLQNGVAQWKIKASRQAVRVWNEPAVIDAVLGQRLADASQILKRNLGLENPPRIILAPEWWPFLPGLDFRISVRTE